MSYNLRLAEKIKVIKPYIAEAGTVHNETGFTPRQLAEQRDKLLDAMEEIVNYENARRRMAASGRSQELPKSVAQKLAETAVAATIITG